jgi:hypothetical protein
VTVDVLREGADGGDGRDAESPSTKDFKRSVAIVHSHLQPPTNMYI